MEDQIAKRIKSMTGKSLEYFKGKQRDRESFVVRACLYKDLRDKGYSLKKIGQMFNRDHSTVMHSLDQVEYWMQLPKIHVCELNMMNKLCRERPSMMEMLSNFKSFVQLVKLNGTAFYHFDTGNILTQIIDCKEMTESTRIRLENFSVDSILETNGIVIKKIDLLEDPSVMMMGEVSGNYVRVRLITNVEF